jgi:hypothetical protein
MAPLVKTVIPEFPEMMPLIALVRTEPNRLLRMFHNRLLLRRLIIRHPSNIDHLLNNIDHRPLNNTVSIEVDLKKEWTPTLKSIKNLQAIWIFW